MRVMLINAVCGIGSTGRIVSDMWSLLKSKGHEVKVVFGVGEARNVDEKDLIKCNDMRGYYLHNALARITDRAGFYSIVKTQKLIKQIKAFAPDIIHLHNLHGFYVNIKVLFEYLAQANIPVVWTLHDCWTMTGHCSHFAYIGCEKWKTGCYHCPQKKTYPISLVLDQSKRNYMDKKRLFTSVPKLTICTPSKWLADIVKQSYLSNYPVHVMPNGIDLEVFKPTPSDFRKQYDIGNRKIILAVSNVWSQKKGFFDICKLAEMIDREKEVLVIVGVTEEQQKQLPQSVIAIKRTQNVQELVQIYSAADVFINPTYEDNFPTVNLEALACGTPVVTYNTGGSVEPIHPECGEVVPQGDVFELYKRAQQAERFDRAAVLRHGLIYDKNLKYELALELYNHLYNSATCK